MEASLPKDSGRPEHEPGHAPAGSPLAADLAGKDSFAERPELFVGAAFAGGLALAGLLRLIGR